MSTVLIVVTALSLGVAVLASAVAWRVVRAEGRRSDARVRRLAAEIDGHIGGNADEPVEPVEPASGMPSFPLGPAIAVCAVILAAVVVVAGALSADRGASTVSAASSADNPAPDPAAAGDRPLELVALGHDRSRTALTVRGIVRNPAQGASRAEVAAFVQLYDDRGGLITSGSAPVASAALLPGEESTFVVVMPDAARVERYRVSFRAADNVIPHVDRRAGA